MGRKNTDHDTTQAFAKLMQALPTGARITVEGEEYIKTFYVHPHYVRLANGAAYTGPQLLDLYNIASINLNPGKAAS